MTRAQVRERSGAKAKQALARFPGFGRVLNEVDNRTLGDAPDLIQMEAALALFCFRVTLGTEKCVHNHGDSRDGCATHGKRELPIFEQNYQRQDSLYEIPGLAGYPNWAIATRRTNCYGHTGRHSRVF